MKILLKGEYVMSNKSCDPHLREEKEASIIRLIEEIGISFKDIEASEELLCQMPIDRWLEKLCGPDHGAVYDADQDLWIVPNPKHAGPGFGFIAIRSDRSWFTGVVPPEVFQ